MKQRIILTLLIALLMPIGAWAALAVGDKLTVDGMTFKVTSIGPNEVQVGDNILAAIDMNTEGTVIIPSTVKDPDGGSYSVTSIGSSAFSKCKKMTEIQIPEGVTTISDAFFQCTSLVSVNIPSSVTYIGAAFNQCSALAEVHITDLKAWCGIEFMNNSTANPLVIAQHLYLNGMEVKDLVIPEGTTKIGKFAFYKCNSLTSVTIPSGVTDFGERVFDSCEGLTSVTSASNLPSQTFRLCKNLKDVTLLDGVTNIGERAFRQSGLTKISIPSSLKSVESYAFSECTSLTEVHIKDVASWCAIDFGFNLASYDNNPLYYAHHLFLNGNEIKELVIPEGVSAINHRAFVGCEGLTSVKIPTTVTSIGESAFSGCTGLTAVHISDLAAWCGIDFVRNNSYIACNPLQLAHHLYLNGNEVKDLVIPESVSVLKDKVFDGCEGLNSVTIPEGVTSIGKQAFNNCTNLASVSIPKSLNNIGSKAFDGCTGLIAVHLSDIAAWCVIPFKQNDSGDNPLKIAGHLYMNGVEIKDLVIPEGVTSISYGAFNGCKFNSISIPSSLTSISDFAFSYLEEKKPNTVYIKDLAAWCRIKFGENVPSLSNPLSGTQHLFVDGEEVTDLVIPDGVTEISDLAFYRCNALTSVNTGNTVKKIGEYSFAGCDNLNTVTIGKSVTSIDVAFFGCKELKSVTSLIEDPFEIDKNTFSYRETANGPIIGSSATLYVPVGTKAKYEAIKGWNSFTNIVEMDPALKVGDTFVADGITYRVKDAEKGEVIVGYKEPESYIAVSKDATGIIEIPSSVEGSDGKSYSVTGIQDYAFEGCNMLTGFILPESITQIGEGVFKDCSSLESVNIPKSLENISLLTFKGCSSLEKIHIPESVKEIGYGAFDGCKALNSVNIPVGVTNIALATFQSCESLTSIDIPSTVTSIGEAAFNICGLKSIIIPEGVTTIGRAAFSDCWKAENIIIPSSVTSIGEVAFSRGYSHLTKVTSYMTNPVPISYNTFGQNDYDSYTYATLYVPAGTKAKYEATEGWKEFKNIVEMDVVEDNLTYNFGEEGNLTVTGTVDGQETTIEVPSKIVIDGREYIVTIIAADAFKDNTNLQSVTIPETVEKIGESAFAGCSKLSTMILPKSVNAIGDGAFSGCSSIKTIELPKSVNSIGDGAFKDCTSMSSVKILSSPENVGLDVFAGCDNLKDAEFDCATVTPVLQKTKVERVKMEETVTTIDKEAFRECKNLTDIDIPESVERIGESAFNGCTGIKQIELTKNLNSIGDGAFTGCTEMKLVKVECSPVEVGTDIFVNCDKLEEAVYDCKVITPLLRKTKIERVKIEKSVTDIDKEAFLECKNLAAIDFPESVERIGESAFNGCTGIKAIELPKSVSKIEESAFGKCSEMLTLKIGEGIKEIHSAAFSDCKKLMDVYVYAKELPVTSSEAFKDTDVKQITLHVPEEAVKDYERTVPWIDFKIIKAIVPETISIVMDSSKPVDVYSTAGVLMKQGVTTLKDLKKGVYIIGTRKLLVK